MADQEETGHGSTRCAHEDVRYLETERGAIACMKCGRLFGHLFEDEVFVAYNPADLTGVS